MLKKLTDKQKISVCVIGTLLLGYLFGCICIRFFYLDDLPYLAECIRSILNGGTASGGLYAFSDTVLYVVLVCFLGYSMAGFVLVFPVVFLKAYMTGFYATLCYITYGLRGGIVVATVIMPVSLLLFMVLCVLGAEAVEFSYKTACLKSEDRVRCLKKYSATCAVTLVISVGLMFWEWYLTPYILAGIHGIL